MPSLREIVEFCDTRVQRSLIKDFDGAHNGLQIENSGTVSHIGAAVDAGLEPFRKAVERGIDFLICHHGFFWNPPIPVVGSARAGLKTALDGNLAVYGSHLPLDCHPEIGNNALLAKALGLNTIGSFLEYEGNAIATVAAGPEGGRRALAERLQQQFPRTFTAIEFGSETPERIAILSGSGQSAVSHLKAEGIDTLITGELRQQHFNIAQEAGLNLYPCGHYATETFGVRALAAEVAEAFDLPHSFIEFDCPL